MSRSTSRNRSHSRSYSRESHHHHSSRRRSGKKSCHYHPRREDEVDFASHGNHVIDDRNGLAENDTASHGNVVDGRNGYAENDAARRGSHVINGYPYYNPPLPPVDNQLNQLED